MLDAACELFPDIPRDTITLQTNELDFCNGHYVNITAETWDHVIDLITLIKVKEVPLRLCGQATSFLDNQLVPQVSGHDSSYAFPI